MLKLDPHLGDSEVSLLGQPLTRALDKSGIDYHSLSTGQAEALAYLREEDEGLRFTGARAIYCKRNSGQCKSKEWVHQ